MYANAQKQFENFNNVVKKKEAAQKMDNNQESQRTNNEESQEKNNEKSQETNDAEILPSSSDEPQINNEDSCEDPPARESDTPRDNPDKLQAVDEDDDGCEDPPAQKDDTPSNNSDETQSANDNTLLPAHLRYHVYFTQMVIDQFEETRDLCEKILQDHQKKIALLEKTYADAQKSFEEHNNELKETIAREMDKKKLLDKHLLSEK